MPEEFWLQLQGKGHVFESWSWLSLADSQWVTEKRWSLYLALVYMQRDQVKYSKQNEHIINKYTKTYTRKGWSWFYKPHYLAKPIQKYQADGVNLKKHKAKSPHFVTADSRFDSAAKHSKGWSVLLSALLPVLWSSWIWSRDKHCHGVLTQISSRSKPAQPKEAGDDFSLQQHLMV